MISHGNSHTENVPALSSLQKKGVILLKQRGCNLKQWYWFPDEPERIPRSQKCLHGGNERAGPTGSAGCAAGCPVDKSDGSLQSTRHFLRRQAQQTVKSAAPSWSILCMYLISRGQTPSLKEENPAQFAIPSFNSKPQQPLRATLTPAKVCPDGNVIMGNSSLPEWGWTF